MLVQRAYKTELDLNDRQVTACKQHAGAARWAYNWGLRVKQERYQSHQEEPHCHRACTASSMPSRRPMFPGCTRSPSVPHKKPCGTWMPPSQHFFRRCALKKQGKWKGKLGYPQFKTKKKGLGSFRLTGRDCGLG